MGNNENDGKMGEGRDHGRYGNDFKKMTLASMDGRNRGGGIGRDAKAPTCKPNDLHDFPKIDHQLQVELPQAGVEREK